MVATWSTALTPVCATRQAGRRKVQKLDGKRKLAGGCESQSGATPIGGPSRGRLSYSGPLGHEGGGECVRVLPALPFRHLSTPLVHSFSANVVMMGRRVIRVQLF